MVSLWIALVFLILVSGFFSASETAMMSLNRYRLRSKVRQGDLKAGRVARLLSRPDRLLGVILLGNTFANILASSVATLLSVHYFGELGVILSTVALTVIVLIFAETAPKTFSALHPEVVAFPFSYLLQSLLKVLSPFVWAVTFIANGVLWICRVHIPQRGSEALSFEEIRVLVSESGEQIARGYQNMLLRVLDLEKVTVEHIMIPLNEVYAINLTWEWDEIVEKIVSSRHAYVPFYSVSPNAIDGVLSVRQALRCMVSGGFGRADLIKLMRDPYYIPAGADLTQQLLYFRDKKQHFAVVLDEYGNVQGVLSMNDILEEVVGEFTGMPSVEQLVVTQKDGSVLVDGVANVLELNRYLSWCLPIMGPKTLSGLLIEQLEMIPEVGVGIRLAGYPMEILSVDENRIATIRVWPALYRQQKTM